MKKLLGNGGDDGRTNLGRTQLREFDGANLADRALGAGSTRPGTLVGKENAVYEEVNLTGLASLADVRIGHSLGKKPVLVELVEARNSAGVVHAMATPILKHRWNARTARVAVNLVSGAGQAGTVLKFRVSGE